MNRTLALTFLLTAPLWTQDKKPDLSGHWTAKPKNYQETIQQKGPVVTISGANLFLKLTTDDRECINEVNGNEFHSKTHWEGAKLVTTVTGDRGLSMVEVRSLSADGKTQTVETYMGQTRTGSPMVRVEEKN
ncbi:MAG TPA: hypothetical protein VG456_27175 [Candidatus Sulfopaludibacter sp.]|jgi:hypothetical protein|nr:hypothetical protein [Candidatus Sulfopaludibacter sp.]